MLRSSLAWRLKHRPAHVPTEISSNRYCDDKFAKKARDAFMMQPFPRKLVIHNWRFFLRPGKATSGSALGQEFTKLGLKAMDFCKLFNDRTKPLFKEDTELMLRVQVYYDKTYTWRIEPPPIPWFVMRAVRKKRRETGPVEQRGAYTAYVTLEMLYEIAKYRYQNFGTETNPEAFETPNLERRVEKIALLARRMGIAIIGVDCPSSPVAGKTTKQYEKESAEYRTKQYELYMQFKQKEFEERAPLAERLHRPDVSKLSYDKLKEAINRPDLMDALWRATAPDSKYLRDLKDRKESLRLLQHAGWIGRDMTLQEAKAYFLNWRMPSVEQVRAMREEGSDGEAVSWGRDEAAATAAAVKK